MRCQRFKDFLTVPHFNFQLTIQTLNLIIFNLLEENTLCPVVSIPLSRKNQNLIEFGSRADKLKIWVGNSNELICGKSRKQNCLKWPLKLSTSGLKKGQNSRAIYILQILL